MDLATEARLPTRQKLADRAMTVAAAALFLKEMAADHGDDYFPRIKTLVRVATAPSASPLSWFAQLLSARSAALTAVPVRAYSGCMESGKHPVTLLPRL